MPETEYVDVINLKVDDMFFRDLIIQEDGIMPVYHMNKMQWISALLDGTVPEKKVDVLKEELRYMPFAVRAVSRIP